MEIILIALAAAVLFLPGFYVFTGAMFTLVAVAGFALIAQRYPFSKGATGTYYLGEGEAINRGEVKGGDKN